jgi:hypothetical protein
MTSRRRYRVLPSSGRALVSTDLHGNGEDFRALREPFIARSGAGEELHWVLLGDLVHGPDDRARFDDPQLYGFEDESFAIVEGVSELVRQHPGRVHLILGNHDHAHIGGPPVAKFYVDEAAQLESTLDRSQIKLLHELFDSAMLFIVAPCGVVMSHGAPNDMLATLEPCEHLSFDWRECSSTQRSIMDSFMTSYGQMDITAQRLLLQLGRAFDLELGVVIHGHDRELEGVFTEGRHQICPVLFGAYRKEKRYLELDLSARYRSIEDLREGREIKRLHS